MSPRRRWVSVLVAMTAMSGVLIKQSPVQAIGSGSPPNVLIIVTDDQRQGLNVMPNTHKRLVKQGIKYPNAYVTTPLCCPSRSSIMTGRYAHNTNVRNNKNQAGNLDQQTTIQYYLQQQIGYRTGIFGKYLNGWDLSQAPPYFNDYVITKSSTYYDGTYNVNGTMTSIPDYSTTYLTSQTIDFIQKASRNPTNPWYTYLAYDAPHSHYTAELKYADASVPRWKGNPAVFETDKSDKPRFIRESNATYRGGKRVRKKQFRTLMSVDDGVGKIFNTLKREGQLDNTIVFFISDNAVYWGEHGRLAKSLPYLQDVNVPMMVRWPGAAIPAGTSDERIVANIDIVPTIMQVVGGITPTAPVDGRSLLDPTWTRSHLLLEYWCSARSCRPWASDLTPAHQYTEWYDPASFETSGSYVTDFTEYYNLAHDPWQLTNLLRDEDPSTGPDAQSIDVMHQQLAQERHCVGASQCP